MLDLWEKIHPKLAPRVDLQVALGFFWAETIPAVFSGVWRAVRVKYLFVEVLVTIRGLTGLVLVAPFFLTSIRVLSVKGNLYASRFMTG